MPSSYQKQFVCLANSKKLQGRCVAGKELEGFAKGDWLRPVSARPSGELNFSERTYGGNQEPQLLDVIEASFQAHRQHRYQSENHLIDNKIRWKKVGMLNWAQAASIADHVQSGLWTVGCSSSYGMNDQIPIDSASGFGNSLVLLKIDKLCLSVVREWPDFNKDNKVRARFRLNSLNYALKVTDPIIENDYVQRPHGDYNVGEALVCVSMSEPYKDIVYKIVASVILPKFSKGQ
jgi:hypothetical protein